MAILVDSGALYALTDSTDKHHNAIAKLVTHTTGVLVVPAIILPEVSYLINKYLSPEVEVRVLRSIASAEGGLRLEGFTMPDLLRAAQVVEQYSDARVGLVDAALVAVAERLNLRQVLTLDRRHFAMFRPSHCSAFEILP